MPTISNVGSQPIKWKLRRASAELGVSISTLVTKLNEAGQTADESKTFPTRSIVAALYDDAHRERLAKTIAERRHKELETAILKGDYLNQTDLERTISQVAEGMLQIIKSSALSRQAQDDIRRQIAAIPVIIRDVA
jgi:hypothetical protein